MRIRIEENSVAEEDEPIRLDRLKCTRRILLTKDGYQHVVLANRHRSLHLLCEGQLILNPSANLVIQLDGMRYMNLKRSTLRVLLSLYRGTRPSQTLRCDTQATLQLRDALMVFDGKQLGLSDREIAIALYGKQRVEEEWASRCGPLRARVRRLVRKGQQLVNGGYLQLMR